MTRGASRVVYAVGRFDELQVANCERIQVHRVMRKSDANLPDVIEGGGRLSFPNVPQHRRAGLDSKREGVTTEGRKGMDVKMLLQHGPTLLQVEPEGGLNTAAEAVQFDHPALFFRE